jgi:DNA-binding MarR family transcriptional regulator
MLTPHEYMQSWVNLTYTGPFLLNQLSTEMEKAFGVSVIEQEFLGQVGKAGGEIRMVDLAHNLWVSKAAVTKIVDRLEARGLVERGPSPMDRRVTNITLTKEGSALLGRSWKLLRSWVEKNFAKRLSDAEIRQLSAILQKLLESHDQWGALGARLRGIKKD